MLKKDDLPQYDPSITPDNLMSLHQKRFLQVQKDYHDILKLTPDEIKHVFHAVVVLCEITLHIYLEKKQKSGHFEMPSAWSEYCCSLRGLRMDMVKLRSECEEITKILENLSASLVFSNKSLMIFFEQNAIRSAYTALVPAVINSGYLRAASNGLFDMEHNYRRFSWVDPDITGNPWFLAYRRFFISSDESQLFSALQLDNQYPNAVVKFRISASEPKSVILYAKSEEILQQKIETLKKWINSSDSNQLFPQKLNIRKALHQRPLLDNLICTQLNSQISSKEMWYFVNITLFLPPMLRIMYGSNVYGGNCFGTAISTLGCSIIPRYVLYIAEHTSFVNSTKEIKQGALKIGDMLYTAPHAFIYLDSDLSLEANGVGAPWIFTNTRNIFKEHHYHFDIVFSAKKIDYETIDFSTMPIEEMQQWGISVYRKISTPKLLDESILQLVHQMTEILVKESRLNSSETEDPTLKDLSEYQSLKELFEQLIEKTQNMTAILGDIEAIKKSLPPSIQKLAPSKESEDADDEAAYKAFEEKFEAFKIEYLKKKNV